MPLCAPLAVSPPVAGRRPHDLVAHGDRREDDWFWLRDPADPEVVAYLEAENEYTEAVLASLGDLRQRLFEEIRGRVKETDVSAPGRRGPWWYYSRTIEGLQYQVHCRLADPRRALTAAAVLAQAEAGTADEEVVLDENKLAEGSDYFALGVFDVDFGQGRLAYAVDLTGGERYTLRFRDLATGDDLADEVPDVYYSSAWSADDQWFFYTRPDDAMRPYQVWRHRLGSPSGDDVLVVQEDDERFFLAVANTLSERYIVIVSESNVTSEVSVLDGRSPLDQPRLIEARRQGVEYSVDHAVLAGEGDVFLILSNDGAENFALWKAPVDQPGRAHWAPM